MRQQLIEKFEPVLRAESGAERKEQMGLILDKYTGGEMSMFLAALLPAIHPDTARRLYCKMNQVSLQMSDILLAFQP